MYNGYARFIARLQLRRFRKYLDISGLVQQNRVYTSLSIVHVAGVLLYTGAIYFVLLKSDPYVMRFIMGWIEKFRIREIFEVELVSASNIWVIYHWIVIGALTALGVHSFLLLLRYCFSVAVLLEDRVMLVKSNLLLSHIHQIPYAQILRFSVKETVLHRLLRIGTVEIQTGERNQAFRFGPIAGFQRFVATATQELVAG